MTEEKYKIIKMLAKLNCEYYMNNNNDVYFIVIENEGEKAKIIDAIDFELQDYYLVFVKEEFCKSSHDEIYQDELEDMYCRDINNIMIKTSCLDCTLDCKFAN